MKQKPTPRDRIYATIRKIPSGRVATYGQIAELAGMPRRARMVGRALRELPDGSRVPWHRVVNASGRISIREEMDSELAQRAMLEHEGVRFNERGQIALARFRWISSAPMQRRPAPVRPKASRPALRRRSSRTRP